MIKLPEHWPTLDIQKRINQKNMRISIKPDKIRLSGPAFASNSELLKFLAEHSDWVNKTLQKISLKTQIELPMEATNNFLFLGGKWIPFEVQTHASNNVKWDKEKGVIIAKIPINPEKTELASIKTTLYKYYAQTIIPREFQEFAIKQQLSFKRIFIRSQKTKWGTCSSNRNLSFNYRLIKCPVEMRYYLYAHEAAHLFHLNHSKAFWNKVFEFDPEYKEHEKWFKKNSPFLFNVD